MKGDEVRSRVERALGLIGIPVKVEQLSKTMTNPFPGVVFYRYPYLKPEGWVLLPDGDGVLQRVEDYGVLAFPQRGHPNLMFFHSCFFAGDGFYHRMPHPYRESSLGLDSKGTFWDLPTEEKHLTVEGLTAVQYLEIYHKIDREASRIWGAFIGVASTFPSERLPVARVVSVGSVVTYLNDVIQTDPDAFGELLEYRVPCNKALGDHSRVQVALEGETLRVGILGILSGLFPPGEEGYPPYVLLAEGVCAECSLEGDTLDAAGWKRGGEICPRCGKKLSWKPLHFELAHRS